MLSSFLAALKAIPELIGLVKELVDGVKSLVSAYQKAQEDTWSAEGKQIIFEIKRCTDDKERAKLAEQLAKLIHNTPSARP